MRVSLSRQEQLALGMFEQGSHLIEAVHPGGSAQDDNT